jgi:opacity protein-like surface antigen
MNLRRTLCLALATAAFATPAFAQSALSRVQVSLFPSSRMVATKGTSVDQPKFKTYTPGASVTVGFGRYFSLEGDVSGSRGNVQLLGNLGRRRSPAVLAGALNATVGLLPGKRLQPYVTAGLGAMRLFQREELGMQHGEMLQSANVGGGVKLMFDGWGVRAEYRYVGMDSTAEERSTFFGPDTRKAHRLAVGLVIGGGR